MKCPPALVLVQVLQICVTVAVAAGYTQVVSGEASYGKDGVKKPGFILKFKDHPEFIRHTHPEPGDAAHQYEAQRPSSDFPYE